MKVPPGHKIKVTTDIGAPTPGERREPRHREPAVLLGQEAKGPGEDSARKPPHIQRGFLILGGGRL